MFSRSAGVLMHVSSLPGEFGIGSFGKEARDFARRLAHTDLHIWQVLPLGHTASFHSPYQCYSAFAGNPFFIDLPTLYRKSLITKKELDAAKSTAPPYACDFSFLEETRLSLLKKASTRVSSEQKEKIAAWEKCTPWVIDYALFMVLSEQFGTAHWSDWEPDFAARKPEAIQSFMKQNQEALFSYIFMQYEFFTEWQALKAEVNALGIGIVGDIPIYLPFDSADVWSHPELFQLDEQFLPSRVAGVPPDYFCEDGQLWGNPLYDWERMKQDKYAWWKERIFHSFSLYDALRIDHFRAFASYWAVPSGSKTAKSGHWEPGPGMDFFRELDSVCPDAPMIAEDLGEIDQPVRDLLKETGFPGMRVMQFGFLSDTDSTHLPHHYIPNTIAYTGTHDNTTTLGWLWEATPSQRADSLDYCGFSGDNWGEGGAKSPAVRAWIRTLWQSASRLAIVQMQDLLGYGGDTKMNTPGIAEKNWGFRFTAEGLNEMDTDFIRHITKLYRRTAPFSWE